MAVNKSFLRFFDLTDSRRPPAELKVASELSEQTLVGTLYAIISILNAIFYENIHAHYKTHTFSMSLCQKNMFTWKKQTFMSWQFHKCPKFFRTGSLCTCIKWYKLFGIVWSLSAWLNGTNLMQWLWWLWWQWCIH